MGHHHQPLLHSCSGIVSKEGLPRNMLVVLRYGGYNIYGLGDVGVVAPRGKP
jgi:hypothetical protein